MALVIFFVVPAVIVDLRTSKIPNAIIVLGYVTGFLYQGICHGYYGIMQGVLGALFPLIVLFPVFVIRGLGAGDLKLLSLAGIFYHYTNLFIVLYSLFSLAVCLPYLKCCISVISSRESNMLSST